MSCIGTGAIVSATMGDVIEINQKRLFTLDQARQLLPVVRRITKSSYDEVQKLTSQFSVLENEDRKDAGGSRIQGVLDEWQRKILMLGCETKGLWLVDFDSGEGYYCWQYPESGIEYFHGYTEGFQGRERIH